MKRLALPALLAAVALVAAVWWLALSRFTAPPAAGSASSGQSPGGSRDASRGSAVIAMPGAQPPVPVRPGVGTPPALQTRDEIRDAPDLRAYYDRVKDLPDPTGERSYRLAEAIFECSIFVDLPVDALSRKLAIVKAAQENPRRNAVLAAMVARCKGFTGMGTGLHEIYQALHARAQVAGYPAEVARSLRFEPLAREPERADEVATGLLASSSDPDVVAEVAQYLVTRNGDARPQPGPDARTRSIAWGLLQCSYGADCGPQSRVLVMTCILMGSCDLVRVEEAVRVQGASQGMLNSASYLRDQLAQRIASRDWAGVGFVERNKSP